MKPGGKLRLDRAALLGAPLALAVVVVGHLLDGGRVRTLFQPTAAVVVFGGTCAAMLLSFPLATLTRAARAILSVFVVRQKPRR